MAAIRSNRPDAADRVGLDEGEFEHGDQQGTAHPFALRVLSDGEPGEPQHRERVTRHPLGQALRHVFHLDLFLDYSRIS